MRGRKGCDDDDKDDDDDDDDDDDGDESIYNHFYSNIPFFYVNESTLVVVQ